MDCVAQSGQKNGVKMKNRRTEKTVCRSFIYMEKASKIAVKQRKQRKKHRFFGAFFGRGFIINSMRKQSTGLFTVKSASTFEFRGSSPSAPAKIKRHLRVSFCFVVKAEGLEPSARGFGAKSTLSVKPRVKIQSPTKSA